MNPSTKSKKMKRNQKFLILIGVLVVLLLGNFLVNRFWSPNPDDTSSTAGNEITLTSLDGSKVSHISYTRGDETVTLLWDNEAQRWLREDDTDFPVRQSRARAMLSAVLNIVSTQQIASPESLAEYGLDKPDCVITVTESDGTETVLALGDQNSFNQNYYLTLNGDTETVHMVSASLHSAYQYTLLELAEMQLPSSNLSPDRLEITTSTSSMNLFYSQKPAEIFYTDEYSWFHTDENGILHALNTASADALAELVLSPTWTECAAWQPTAAQLKEFGLDTPAATVQLFEEDKASPAVTLLIGDYDGDSCYAMLKDSSLVYRIASEDADLLRFASYETLCTEEILSINWTQTEQIVLNDGTDSSTLTFTYTAENGADNSKLNGNVSSNDDTDALLLALDSLTAIDPETDPVTEHAPELTLTFALSSTRFPELTLTLTQYNSESYLVQFNGENRLVSRTQAESLLTAADAFF